MDLGEAQTKDHAAEEAAALYLVEPPEEAGEERPGQEGVHYERHPAYVQGVTADEAHHVLGAPSIEQGAFLDGSAQAGGQFGGPASFIPFQLSPLTTRHIAEPSAREMHAIIPTRGGKRQRNTAEKEEEPWKRARNRGRRDGSERSKARRMDISPLPLRLLVRSAVYEDITVVVARDTVISELRKAIEEQSNGRLRESFRPTLLTGRTPLNKDSLTLKQVGIVDDDTVIGFLAKDTRALIESAGLQPFYPPKEETPLPSPLLRPSPNGEAAARALVGLGSSTAEGIIDPVAPPQVVQTPVGRPSQRTLKPGKQLGGAAETFTLASSSLTGPRLSPSQLPPGYYQVSAAELLMRGMAAAAARRPAARNAKQPSPLVSKPPPVPTPQAGPSPTPPKPLPSHQPSPPPAPGNLPTSSPSDTSPPAPESFPTSAPSNSPHPASYIPPTCIPPKSTPPAPAKEPAAAPSESALPAPENPPKSTPSESNSPLSEPQTATPLTGSQTSPPPSEPQTSPPFTELQIPPPLTEPQTAPPLSEPQTAPPLSEPQTALPSSEPQTALPPSEPQTASPLSEPQTAPPPSEPLTTPPLSEPQTAPPPSEPKTSPPLSQHQTAPPLSQPQTSPPPSKPETSAPLTTPLQSANPPLSPPPETALPNAAVHHAPQPTPLELNVPRAPELPPSEDTPAYAPPMSTPSASSSLASPPPDSADHRTDTPAYAPPVAPTSAPLVPASPEATPPEHHTSEVPLPAYAPPMATSYAQTVSPPLVEEGDDWEARARAAAMRGNPPPAGEGGYELMRMERPADSLLGRDDGEWDKEAQQLAVRGNHWLRLEGNARYVAMRPFEATGNIPQAADMSPSDGEPFGTTEQAPPMPAVLTRTSPVDPNQAHNPTNFGQAPYTTPDGYGTPHSEYGFGTAGSERIPVQGEAMLQGGHQWQMALGQAQYEKGRKQRHPTREHRRARRLFTVGEVEALVTAVERLGTGRWRDVKQRAFPLAKHRTYADLKDKWKTLVRTAQIAPSQRRGVEVPEELLERVTRAQAFWRRQAQFDERYYSDYGPSLVNVHMVQGGLPYSQVMQDGGISLVAHANHPYPGHDPPPPFVEELQAGPDNERHQPGDFHHAHVMRPEENRSQGLGRFGNPNSGHGEGVQNGALGEQRPLGRDRSDGSRADVEGRQLLQNTSSRSRADVYVPSLGVESLRAAYERKVSGDTPLEGYRPGAIAFYGDPTDGDKYSEDGSIQEGRPDQFQQNNFQGAHAFEVNPGNPLS